MNCLTRSIRLNHLKLYSNFVRHLTLVNVPTSSTSPKLILTNYPVPQPCGINNSWIWQKNDKIQSPILSKIQIDLPNGLKYISPLEEPATNKSLELPTTPIGEISKQATRMIVIRRNKMKRHKLKKLRKRMKFEWAKRRQRREWNKEKEFQAKLIAQCKEGEAFSAEKYVEERLVKLNEVTAELSKIRKARKLKTSKL